MFSARKKSVDLRKAMESVVVPMFCNTSLAASDEQLTKLNKLLSLWESKNNYFDEGIVEKLKQPSVSWSEYQAGLVSQYANSITPITTSTKQTFDNYQAQHQAFVNHALRQISNIEQQKIAIDQQLKAPPPPPPPSQLVMNVKKHLELRMYGAYIHIDKFDSIRISMLCILYTYQKSEKNQQYLRCLEHLLHIIILPKNY